MLFDVLTRVSADTGIHPIQKRTTLIELLNRAAKEMHRELECSKIYREVVLVVPIDKVVSIPSFVGELKGMRMHSAEIPFDLHSVGAPRYVTNTLGYTFKNWRDLGESPVHTKLSEIGKLTITCPEVESEPVTLLIDGQTNKATRIQESVVINDTSKQTTNLFGPELYSIACITKGRTIDITIKDVNQNEVAVLGNVESKTRYKIVDVSTVFWNLDTSDGQSLIDVLYKVPQYNLMKDSDSFYAGDDYDDAWYNMAMFFYLQPIESRVNDALAHRAACFDFLRIAKDAGEGGIIKKLSFGRNKYYGILQSEPQ